MTFDNLEELYKQREQHETIAIAYQIIDGTTGEVLKTRVFYKFIFNRAVNKALTNS